MFFDFALLSSLLFASAVFAAPSSRYGTHIPRGREGHQSRLNDRLEQYTSGVSDSAMYSSNWAGALWDKPNGTFTTVTGTFAVPMPSGQSGAASVWVGIDGDTCLGAILQTGIELDLFDGIPLYAAWYEWYPAPAQYFPDISISPGDVVKLTVAASSTTTGTATVENLTSGQTVSQSLSSTAVLCQQNAEWIVEDFQEDGGLAPFADFGTVTFVDTEASGVGNYTVSGATIVTMRQSGQLLTSVSTDGASVAIQYV